MQFFTTVLALLSATPLLANAAAVDLQPRQAGGLSSIAPLPSDKAFKNTVLARVNKYRAQHGAVPYVWNQAQADFSLVQSNKCAMKHSVSPQNTPPKETPGNSKANIVFLVGRPILRKHLLDFKQRS